MVVVIKEKTSCLICLMDTSSRETVQDDTEEDDHHHIKLKKPNLSSDPEEVVTYFLVHLLGLSKSSAEELHSSLGPPSEWFFLCLVCEEEILLEGKALWDEIERMKVLHQDVSRTLTNILTVAPIPKEDLEGLEEEEGSDEEEEEDSLAILTSALREEDGAPWLIRKALVEGEGVLQDKNKNRQEDVDVGQGEEEVMIEVEEEEEKSESESSIILNLNNSSLLTIPSSHDNEGDDDKEEQKRRKIDEEDMIMEEGPEGNNLVVRGDLDERRMITSDPLLGHHHQNQKLKKSNLESVVLRLRSSSTTTATIGRGHDPGSQEGQVEASSPSDLNEEELSLPNLLPSEEEEALFFEPFTGPHGEFHHEEEVGDLEPPHLEVQPPTILLSNGNNNESILHDEQMDIEEEEEAAAGGGETIRILQSHDDDKDEKEEILSSSSVSPPIRRKKSLQRAYKTKSWPSRFVTRRRKERGNPNVEEEAEENEDGCGGGGTHDDEMPRSSSRRNKSLQLQGDSTVKPSRKEKTACSKCGKNFKDSWHLKRHLRSTKAHLPPPPKNQEERDFPCSKCSKKFKESWLLKRHLRSKTAHRPPPSTTTTCPPLKNQEKGGFPFPCSKCSKKFKNSFLLKRHLRSKNAHPSKDKVRWSCGTCDKGFPTGWEMRRHMLLNDHVPSPSTTERFIQMGKETHSCGTCGQVFFVQSDLDKHEERFHPHQESPRVVKKKTTTKNEKKRVSHSLPPENWSCATCEKGFLDCWNLRRHLLTRDHVPSPGSAARMREGAKETYICEVCGQTFYFEYDLKIHGQKVHHFPGGGGGGGSVKKKVELAVEGLSPVDETQEEEEEEDGMISLNPVALVKVQICDDDA